MKSTRIKIIQETLKTVPKYQLNQLIKSIYQPTTTTTNSNNSMMMKYSEQTYLPLKTRQALIDAFEGEDTVVNYSLRPAQLSQSSQCTKALLELRSDKQAVEAVWMQFRDSKHHSICISSQVGCALKCSFCATGAIGFKRQLTVDEITDQVLYFKHRGLAVDTISFMGMGEALMNPRVFDSLQMLTDPQLFAISPRRINVSTVGIIPGIQRLTKEFPQVNLAFSLHSPFHDQRSQLVPANKTYPLEHCLNALKEHALATNRRIMIAYLLLPSQNDSEQHAKEIVRLFKTSMPASISHLFHINLLRYNPAYSIGTESYQRSTSQHLKRFSSILSANRLSHTVRQSFGMDIDAACGQLYQVAKKHSPALDA